MTLETYLSEALPLRVLDLPPSLDDLIIDEGQDFNEYRLLAARGLLRDGGAYLYLSDDRQDLFDRERRREIGAEASFALIHNCRNTHRINECGNRALADSLIPSMPGIPVGAPVQVEQLKSPLEMAKRAWTLAQAVRGERVAILSPYTGEGSSLSKAPVPAGTGLTQSIAEWEKTGLPLFSTIRAFKGVESDHVIVIDVTTPGSSLALSRHDLYVACTRARTSLAVLCSTAEPTTMLRGASS